MPVVRVYAEASGFVVSKDSSKPPKTKLGKSLAEALASAATTESWPCQRLSLSLTQWLVSRSSHAHSAPPIGFNIARPLVPLMLFCPSHARNRLHLLPRRLFLLKFNCCPSPPEDPFSRIAPIQIDVALPQYSSIFSKLDYFRYR